MIEGFSISPQQKTIWQYVRNSSPMGLTSLTAIRLDGPLQEAALRAALADTVNQHESLRTCFKSVPGMKYPLQVVGEPMIHWQETLVVGGADELATALDSLQREMGGILNLNDGPTILAALLQSSSRRHTLVLGVSALQADRLSLEIWVAQLCRCYGIRAANQIPEPEEPPQYIDYCEYLKELTQSKEAEPGLAYWQKRRPGARLEIPLLWLQKEEAGFDPMATPSCPHGADTVRLLEEMERKYECPAVAVCLTVWAILLHRLSDQTDLLIGTAFHGRTDEDLFEAIGPFMRFLPVSFQLNAEQTLADLAPQCHAQMQDADAWQDCYRWDDGDGQVAGLERRPFCFEYGYAAETHQGAGVQFIPCEERVHNEDFNIKLSCLRRGGDMTSQIHWNRRRIDEAGAARLVEQYCRLLQEAVRNPEKPIGALILLPENQRRLLVGFDRNPQFLNQEPPLTRYFESWAERQPQAPALETEGISLGYDQLDRRVDSLAWRLRQKGVVAETFVGLCLPQSSAAIVGLLAILKCGGVYLPLDPGYPRDRLAYLMGDANPSVIVTTADLARRLDLDPSRVLIADAIEKEPLETAHTPVPLFGEQAAYMIYTSGSTGLPKGTLISHGALCDHCLAMRAYYAVTTADRYLQFASLNFDASLEQILTPLISGATLVIRDDEMWTPAIALKRLREWRLTVVNLPTSYWHLLAQEWLDLKESLADLPLRLMIVGGEAMYAEQVRNWSATGLDQVRLINAYGPTEATITATAAQVRSGASSSIEPVSIGRPLPNRAAYVLDANLNLLPIGHRGILFLGGQGLARGYHQKPALTAEYFIPDPFTEKPAGRLYKTNDLAIILPDLQIRFLGRVDHQVKVRGYRIELGEIEAALARHPRILEAAVVLVQDKAEGKSDQQLAAYCVAGEGIAEQDLNLFLRDQLPDYMVPQFMVLLASLPHTSGGKIDRAALSGLKIAAVTAESAGFIDAREETLAGIWCDILNLERVGRDANFFELGGHSLSAMRLVAKICNAFDVDITIREVFASHNLADLARTIGTKTLGDHQAVPPIEAVSRQCPQPASFAQQRLWLVHNMNPTGTDFHITSHVRITGALDEHAFRETLAELVRRHESLRTRFFLQNDVLVQQVIPFDGFEMPLVDLCDLPPAERESRALALAERKVVEPFDLVHGPLIRAVLVRLNQDTHLLIFGMHHIISDGWSVGIFTRELVALYGAFSRGEPSPLEALPLQYVDFSVWQRAYLQGATLERELAFWSTYLAGAANVQSPPGARPRPDQPTHKAHWIPFQFSPALTQACKNMALARDATLFMVLLAAFKTAIYCFTDEEDVVLGTDVANRNRGEMEGVIGFFINQLVLRTDLSGNPSFHQLIERISQTTLNAYTHQDLPFDKLVEVLKPQRTKDIHPLFQIKLVLQNAPGSTLALPGLSLDVTPVLSDTMLLDLKLIIWEEGDTIKGMAFYSKDLYQEATVTWVMRFFEMVLQTAAENAHTRLMTFKETYLSEASKQRQTQEAERKTDRRSRFQKQFGPTGA